MIDTGMLRERDAAINQAAVQTRPIKRRGAAEEPVGLVLFLNSAVCSMGA